MATPQEAIRERLLLEIQTLNAERNSMIRMATMYMMIFSMLIVAFSMRQLSKYKGSEKEESTSPKPRKENDLSESPKIDHDLPVHGQLRSNSVDSRCSTEVQSRTSSNESTYKCSVEKRALHVSNISPSSSFKNSKSIKSGSGSRFYANVVTRRRDQ